jgi:hypothetical protein
MNVEKLVLRGGGEIRDVDGEPISTKVAFPDGKAASQFLKDVRAEFPASTAIWFQMTPEIEPMSEAIREKFGDDYVTPCFYIVGSMELEGAVLSDVPRMIGVDCPDEVVAALDHFSTIGSYKFDFISNDCMFGPLSIPTEAWHDALRVMIEVNRACYGYEIRKSFATSLRKDKEFYFGEM